MKIRFRRDGFPVEIPWPGRGEWARYRMREPNTNKCCMSGWVWAAFTGNAEPTPEDVRAAKERPKMWAAGRRVAERAKEMASKRGYGNDGRSVIRFNNHPDTTDAMRSAFWAELWGSFDYEECP